MNRQHKKNIFQNYLCIRCEFEGQKTSKSTNKIVPNEVILVKNKLEIRNPQRRNFQWNYSSVPIHGLGTLYLIKKK